MTGTDFMNLCDLNGIIVTFTPDCKRGFYYFVNGRHFIVLSTRLSPISRNFVAWHEFAHFLQNYYKRKIIAAFSDVQPKRASEQLADVFAIIACRPDHIRITGPLDFIEMLMTGK